MLSLKKNTFWKILLISLLILVFTRFIVVGTAKVLFNTQSSDGDESAYLELGLALREDGVLTDGTRPPLYPLLLTPVAYRDWSYFTWAKIITLGIGALTVLVTFVIGRQLFNVETGLLAAFFLAWNREFHLRASTVYADTLLVMLFLLAWYFLIKSFEKTRYCILAGFFVGLAYLTKSSVLLLLVVWSTVALWHYRQRIFTQIQLLLVPLAFLITTSPLLFYNWNNFGQPFYSFATTHVMWMDRWAESQVADTADLPTLSTYLETHTLNDIMARLERGISRLNPELILTLIPSRNFEPSWLGYLVLGGLLVGLIWFVVFQRNTLHQAFQDHQITMLMVILLFIPFYLISAWYAQVLIESRFLIPILGPFYIVIAAGIVALMSSVWDAVKSYKYLALGYTLLVGLIVGWGLWWLITTTQLESWSLHVNPFLSDIEANIAPEEVLTWLKQDHPDALGQAQVVFGPSKSLPLWKFPRHFHFERIPSDVRSWSNLQAYLQNRVPDYIVIDSDTARRRREAMGDYIHYSDNGVEFETVPPEWMLTHIFGNRPHNWVIFSPQKDPTFSVEGNVDNQFALIGYNVVSYFDVKEPFLQVTLTWQVLANPQRDYTVFLHMTAADGFVKAQGDKQPFEGLWPTHRWVKGDILADRYTIFIDETVQPGDYLLITGMYDAETGQRLPLTEETRAPSPDAILLGDVRVE
ncbi:MAG: glycosyltransferase family 39 protein [Anaerolineae bacterium]|nr:glycosyltransferase family 39 protein [Anaerolineae bacterium]